MVQENCLMGIKVGSGKRLKLELRAKRKTAECEGQGSFVCWQVRPSCPSHPRERCWCWIEQSRSLQGKCCMTVLHLAAVAAAQATGGVASVAAAGAGTEAAGWTKQAWGNSHRQVG